MFKKLGRALTSKNRTKLRLDVRINSLQGLPSTVAATRVVWARDAKVQMTKLAHVTDGTLHIALSNFTLGGFPQSFSVGHIALHFHWSPFCRQSFLGRGTQYHRHYWPELQGHLRIQGNLHLNSYIIISLSPAVYFFSCRPCFLLYHSFIRSLQFNSSEFLLLPCRPMISESRLQITSNDTSLSVKPSSTWLNTSTPVTKQ